MIKRSLEIGKSLAKMPQRVVKPDVLTIALVMLPPKLPPDGVVRGATACEGRGAYLPPRRGGPQGVIVHGRRVWELEQDVLIVGKVKKDAARKTAPSNQGLESGKAN